MSRRGCFVLALFLPLACGSGTPDAGGTGGVPATGGTPGTGGTPATGGTPGTGGNHATGGAAGGGGHASGGSGGRAGGGGSGGYAGVGGPGGHPGTGGTAGAHGGHGGTGGAKGGNGGHPGSGGASGGDFAAVVAIFATHCTNCHDASLSGLPTYPALSLTASDAHAALVNKPADETCGGIRVVPGDPNASYLVQKLTQSTPCDGQQMPRAFEVGPAHPLSAAEIATITAWISAGAPP